LRENLLHDGDMAVIPANAGIHNFQEFLDARLRGHDITK